MYRVSGEAPALRQLFYGLIGDNGAEKRISRSVVPVLRVLFPRPHRLAPGQLTLDAEIKGLLTPERRTYSYP